MRLELFLTFAVCVGLATSEYVDSIQQNYASTTNRRLARQVNRHLKASYFYQAYSQYFNRADVALPGFAKYFKAASDSETEDADELAKYVNKRGGHVPLGDIEYFDMCNLVGRGLATLQDSARTKPCICFFMSTRKNKGTSGECTTTRDWQNGLWALHDALVLERFINSQYLDLHNDVDADPHLGTFLEDRFLDGQVKVIKELGDLVRQMERADSGVGEYLMDQNLQ